MTPKFRHPTQTRARSALAFAAAIAGTTSGGPVAWSQGATAPAAAKVQVPNPAPSATATKSAAAVATPAATTLAPECAQTADRAKAVAACTAFLKDLGKVVKPDQGLLASALSARASAYSAQALMKPAFNDVTRALYHAPKDARLWSQRGQIRQVLGQNIRCAADFSIALKNDPKLVQALIGRSECFRRVGALPKAIADADEALKVDPKSTAALTTRAYAQLRLGKFDRAIADADDALKIDPNSARAYLTRGLAQERTDKAKADADVKKALELDPQIKTEKGLAETLKRFKL